MAQIIKNRRGSLERISAVSSSFQKGELIITSGSSNLTTTNGSSILFAATESGSVQAVNRFLMGTNAPNIFSSSIYNGLVKGVPYYASGSSTLYLLGSDQNDIPDLTGNISNFSSSVAVSLNALSQSIGSGTIGNSVNLLNTFSGSTLGRLTNIESTSASVNNSVAALNTSTASQQISIDALNVTSASLNTFSGSTLGRLTNLESTSASVNTSIAALNTSTASQQISIDALNSYTSSNTSTTALNAFTASANGRLNSLESTSASLNTFSSSQESKDTTLQTLTASFSSSLGDIQNYTSSLRAAFTASGVNVTFNGDTTVKGNLFVQGTQTVVDSTTINLADNILVLNAAGTSDGGLVVRDATGGSTTSGSLLWDVTNDYWKAGALGAESKLLRQNGDSVVSGSSQITITSTTGFGDYSGSVATAISASTAAATWTNLNGKPAGIVSGSSQVVLNDADKTGFDTTDVAEGTNLYYTDVRVKTKLNTETVVSSSAQVTSLLPTGTVSGSSQVLGGTGIVSGSSQITYADISSIPGGIVSGSAQVTPLLPTGVVSGSTQISYGSISNIPTNIISGATDSNNIDFRVTDGIITADLKGGVVSGSSQIMAGSTTNFASDVKTQLDSSNVISGSVQVDANQTTNFATGIKTQLNINTVVSGSSQITYASISSIPGGIVSGSSQVDINNTTNFSSYSSSVSSSISALSASVGSGNVGVAITNLNLFTSSQETKNSTLSTYTASVDGRLSNIEITSASVNNSVSALNTSSASQQISIDALNVVSSSTLGRLTNIETTSASVNNSVTLLNSSTASQQTSIDALNSYTSSNTSTTALNAFTASADGRLTNLEATTASLNTSVAALNTVSASNLGRLSNLEATSASVNNSVTALNTSTASQQISIDALNVVSASNLGRLTNLETTSASVNTSVAALNVSSASLNSFTSSILQALTASGVNLIANGNLSVAGNLTVAGTTTAVNSTTIQLGDNIIELNGTGVANGGLLIKDPTGGATVSGSLLWDSTNDYWKAGALGAESKLLRAGGDNVVTESAQILFTGINGYETYSGSVSASFAEVIANVGSGVGVSITNLNSFSSSTLGRLTNIESTSASVNTSVAALNTASGNLILSASTITAENVTQHGRLNNLESTSGSLNSFSSSINTTIKTKLNAETVVSGSSQIDITSTTGYSTFSGSIATSISASVAGATWENLVGKPSGIVSGSVQVDITSTTGFSTFSSSIETRISLIDGGTY